MTPPRPALGRRARRAKPARESIAAECLWRGRRVVLREVPWNDADGPLPKNRYGGDHILSVVDLENDDGTPHRYQSDLISLDVHKWVGHGTGNVDFLKDAMSALNVVATMRNGVEFKSPRPARGKGGRNA